MNVNHVARMPDDISRRRFLGLAATAAGGAVLGSSGPEDSQPTLTMPPGTPPSRVVQIQSRHVVKGSDVHRALLGEMLGKALTAFTQTDNASQAWRTILKPDDVVGIKFNRSGQAAIGTTEAVADALIKSMIESGIGPEQIVCIECPDAVTQRSGTTPARAGFDRNATDFGSGTDQLASVLGQITALIDVPFLKTHNIAGLTCALKNLSHGLVKHPARYHSGGCSPYIADIVALEAIRGRLRLCVVDALRVVFDGGPQPSDAAIADAGTILTSADAVAVDAVGLTIINELREQRGFPHVATSPQDIRYLAAAHRRGLGIALPYGIDVSRIDAP